MNLNEKLRIIGTQVMNRNYRELCNIESKTKTLVLLSGGLDSTVALYLAKTVCTEVAGMEFFYEERHTQESSKVKTICDLANVNLYSMQYPSAKSEKTTTLFESNSVYYSLASNLAIKEGFSNIFAGPILSDWTNPTRLDASPAFYKLLNKLLKVEYGERAPKIITPLIYLTKTQVVQIGTDLAAPLELTWSCIKEGLTPCSSCTQCKERKKAFGNLKHEKI